MRWRLALRKRAFLALWKGGLPMITYSELFQFSLVVIGIVALFIQANKRK